ncbi:hypothetical protein CAPTEDRAFT_126656, partial [Capitella teleta]
IDISKAFDTLDHEILLNKFYKDGIQNSLFDWLHAFLKNRKQFVQIGGSESSE